MSDPPGFFSPGPPCSCVRLGRREKWLFFYRLRTLLEDKGRKAVTLLEWSVSTFFPFSFSGRDDLQASPVLLG